MDYNGGYIDNAKPDAVSGVHFSKAHNLVLVI